MTQGQKSQPHQVRKQLCFFLAFCSAAADSYCEKPLGGTRRWILLCYSDFFHDESVITRYVMRPQLPLTWTSGDVERAKRFIALHHSWRKGFRTEAMRMLSSRKDSRNSKLKNWMHQALGIIHVTNQWWCRRNKHQLVGMAAELCDLVGRVQSRGGATVFQNCISRLMKCWVCGLGLNTSRKSLVCSGWFILVLK